jgi:AcrR family transcriptional regulator
VVTARVNQKERTRTAIVEATRELIRAGSDVTMPAVAEAARVSEATAYRYFPDLVSLLRDAVDGAWPGSGEVMAPVAGLDDPVERVAHATEFLLWHVHAYRSAVRAMISAAITRPAEVLRPGHRLGLIDAALEPLSDPSVVTQLKRDLAVVMSAEALFSLMDLCGLSAQDAIASAVSTARAITMARIR